MSAFNSTEPEVKIVSDNKEIRNSKISRPWKKASLLDVPDEYKDSNYVYRFADRDKLATALSEQWEIDRQIKGKMAKAGYLPPSQQDGSGLDSSYVVREMVLIRQPKELKEQRDAYYLNMNNLKANTERETSTFLNQTVDGEGNQKGFGATSFN